MPPFENSSCTRSSKRRIVAIERYALSSASWLSCIVPSRSKFFSVWLARRQPQSEKLDLVKAGGMSLRQHRTQEAPMFIRNAWYIAAWADELSEKPIARRICNEPVVLYRDREGRPGVLLDMCCHRGAPLHLGRVVDQGLECGYHGLIFDRSGQCVCVPGQ